MRLWITITLLTISSVCFSQTHKYYFSSSTGNDNNSAAQAQSPNTPWATISKLQQFYSSLVAGDSALFKRGDVFSVPAGGLVPTKGGTATGNINIGAYGTGANPLWSGLNTITGWSNLGGNIWESINSVATNDTVWHVVQGGVQQRMGRTPNWQATGNEGYVPTTISSHTQASNPLFASGTWNTAWTVGKKERFIIGTDQNNAQAGGLITFTPTAPETNYNLNSGWGFFEENSAATLDQQGEWFFDKSTHKIRFFSTTSPGTVTISAVNNLVVLNNRQFTTFSNIDFTGANNAAFLLTGVANGGIFNCNFIHNHNVVLCFQSGGASTASANFKFQNCTTDWTDNIVFNPTSEFNGYYFGFNTANHTALFVGLQGNGDGQAQVLNGRADNAVIENNTIKNVGFNGIGLSGGNVFCRRNNVDSTNLNKDDGAGIYFQSSSTTQARSWISQNTSTNTRGDSAGTNPNAFRPFGIYLDGGTVNVNVDSNNVAKSRYGGIFINTTNQNINVIGNTAFDAVYVLLTSGPGSPKISTMTGNIFVGKATTDFTANHMNYLQPYTGSTFNNNVYARPINDNQTLTRDQPGTVLMTLPQWQQYSGQDPNSTKSPKAITDTTSNSIRYVQNPSSVPITISLNGNTWLDMKNISYPGAVTLQPYTSKVLIFGSTGGGGQPLSATAVALVNPLKCAGDTTTGQVNVTGGNPPYQYEIGNAGFVNSNLFHGLGAGSYTFTVKDQTTTTTATLIITAPTAISVTNHPPTITVNGQTGNDTLVATGGTPPYQYSINNGSTFQSGPIFVIGAGNYNAVVKDGNGCTARISFTLTQPSVFTLTLTPVTNPLRCAGDTTTLNAVGAGGTLPYKYSLNGASPQASGAFHGLGANTYQVTATDGANVVVTKTITITAPAAQVLTESHTPITVNGQFSTVTLNGTNGVNPKVWTLGGTSQSSPVFNNIPAGNYQAVVTDANGCKSNILQFTITQPTLLVAGATITKQITCNGANNGQITGSASNGTPPYDYQLNGGARQPSAIFNNLTPGTYKLTVHDAAGAAVSALPLTLSQPAPIVLQLAFGASAPTNVNVTVQSGGTPPFTYKLDNTSNTTGLFTNVGAGNHTILVTDGLGCTAQQQFNIGSTLGITLSVGTIQCNGATALAQVGGTGGTPPYGFQWSNGQPTNQQNLGAGTWSVRVTDADNHTKDTTFSLGEPPPMIITPNLGTITVNGGTAVNTFSVSGGTPGYTYSLDGVTYQGSNSFTLGAGNYKIFVKDSHNCIQTANFTLTQPGPLVPTISRGSAIACAGGTQQIIFGLSGGTPPYTGTGTFNEHAGLISFHGTDAFGASADTSILVNEPPALTLGVSFTPILVPGGTSTVTGTGGGGTGTLNYKLGVNGTYGASPIFAGVPAGTDTMFVKDANNCVTQNIFSITQPQQLTISVVVTTANLNCAGDQTLVTASTSGGTAPITLNQPTSQNLGAGVYHYSATDQFGQKADTFINITAPSAISLSQIIQYPNPITGATTDSLWVQNAGGLPFAGSTYDYKLDAGSFVRSDSAFKGNLGNVTGGLHTVTIRDANGCIATFPVQVNTPPPAFQGIKIHGLYRHVYRQKQ